jgi:ethanolamine-phosphate phospho-lyase
MGKSMGNGFPVAALMTRRDITDKFQADGLEYFNTFGGNPVSCRAAIAVIDIIEKEKLMENARNVGAYLLQKLKEIGERYEIIGDVRGRGLFIGIDIIRDSKTRASGIAEAKEIKYRLREHMIIISLDGPDHNVIKFKS